MYSLSERERELILEALRRLDDSRDLIGGMPEEVYEVYEGDVDEVLSLLAKILDRLEGEL